MVTEAIQFDASEDGTIGRAAGAPVALSMKIEAASGPSGGSQSPPDRPEGPSGPDGPTDQREREGGVATRTRSTTARPQRYKVLLYNDNYTPMEFVVALLEQVFGKSPAAATQIMLAIHRTGLGVAGVFVLEIAETKVASVHTAAEQSGYPLRAGLEKE
jgi:ATP-dependent Clp protease adaptor protein ClpS